MIISKKKNLNEGDSDLLKFGRSKLEYWEKKNIHGPNWMPNDWRDDFFSEKNETYISTSDKTDQI